MYQSAIAVILIVGSSLSAVDLAIANNNLFLPGDAFFPTTLTRADIEQLQSLPSEERTFTYSSLGGYEGAFCGYAGYNRAKIIAADDAFVENLHTVYNKIREWEPRELYEITRKGKTDLIETNGIRVLFYRNDFEYPRWELGLRYNENWVEEAVKFGHKAEHIRLCCLVQDPDAVAFSWRDATRIAGLDVQVPDIQLKPVPAEETPIIIRGDVKAIVIGSHDLKDFFRYSDDDYLDIYFVDSIGVKELRHEDGRWGSPQDDDGAF